MLFLVVIVGLTCWLAYTTRPTPQTFSKYYNGQGGRLIGGLVERLLGGGRANLFEFTDLYVAWLVRVTETGQLYLGIFGYWLPLVGFEKEVADSIEMGKLRLAEDKSEALKRDAHTLKASGRYDEASKAYEKAANAVTSVDPYSAAELYDEGARCKKMTHDWSAYEAMSLKAAELFRKKNRNIRAAAIFDRLAKYFSSESGVAELRKAINYYERCRELYEIEDDGRGASLAGEICSLQARLGEWTKAADGFVREAKRVFIKDPVFINQSQRSLLFAAICYGMDDSIRMGRRVNELSKEFPWFVECREGRWAMLLSDALCQVPNEGEDYLTLLDDDLRMLPSMPIWFDHAWKVLRSRIEQSASDLT